MTAPLGIDVRSTTIRVALAAAGVVAAVYLVVAVSVVAIVTRNLTAQIDDRLALSLDQITHEPAPPPGGFGAPQAQRPFGAPVIVWTVQPDGNVTSNTSGAVLPAAWEHVASPTTIAIDGVDVRIAGGPAGDRYVVVGQTMESVSQAQSNVIVAEAGIGPALLLLVFLGALGIGRRVAAPIERARQRQLEFTADASHELRTPLSVIEAQTSLALSQERSADWYRTAFERVERENRRIRRLVDDMLWLARFDAAQGQPGVETVDLGVMAAQTADRFAVVAETRHLRLAVHAAPVGVVSAPADWLDRLLGVLLDNACRYSPDGGRIDVTVAVEGNRVRLSVDDAGPGIPEDERAAVFDRFHRATDTPGGAGLGLAIGDAIVRATGGHWRIGTSPAGGASVSVSWPRALVRTTTQENRDGAAPGTTPGTSAGAAGDAAQGVPEGADPAADAAGTTPAAGADGPGSVARS